MPCLKPWLVMPKRPATTPRPPSLICWPQFLTGSTWGRSGEHAQTSTPCGQFSKVPNSWAVPSKWHDTPIALFMNGNLPVHHALSDALAHPNSCHWVQICFGYDKSSTYFSMRCCRRGHWSGFPLPSLRRSLHPPSCQRPTHTPNHAVVAFRSNSCGFYTFLRSSDIITIMR